MQLKLEHAVNKNSADVALLEDLYNYKLQVAEEKENLLKKKIQALEEEYDLKIQHAKVNNRISFVKNKNRKQACCITEAEFLM